MRSVPSFNLLQCTATSSCSSPRFRSVAPGLGRSRATTSTPTTSITTYRLKVTKAEITWHSKTKKPSFIRLLAGFLDVQEMTATVQYITNAIKTKWGEECVIVTQEELEIESTEPTSGI